MQLLFELHPSLLASPTCKCGNHHSQVFTRVWRPLATKFKVASARCLPRKPTDVPPMMLVAVRDVSPFLPLPAGIRLHFVLYAAFWRTCACLERPTSAASLPQRISLAACMVLPKACTSLGFAFEAGATLGTHSGTSTPTGKSTLLLPSEGCSSSAPWQVIFLCIINVPVCELVC